MKDKWIVLDIMGVIFVVGEDIEELLIPYIRQRNPLISSDRIRKLYQTASLGQLTSREFWEILGFEERYPEIEDNYLDTSFTLDPEFHSTLSSLKEVYCLAVLSNDVKEWSAYLREKYHLSTYFDSVIISGEVKARKPASRIFEIFLEETWVSPEDCVFVDDQLKNLQSAAELGFHTIYYQRNTENIEFTPDVTITHFSQLLEMLPSLWKKEVHR